MLSRDEMIGICRDNDGSYDGIFYLAVKSTMIYCLPSCTARFPKIENIMFYSSKSDAEDAGFRGCLRCHSANAKFQPQWLQDLVVYLHDHIHDNLTMSDLEQLTSRHRSTIVEHFQHHYHMTVMEYYRQLRLNIAKRRILQGEDYRDVAFAIGYNSLSGFRSAFKSQFSTTPGEILEVL